MGARVTRQEFAWSYTEEPHATRRNIILTKYPEIKDLFALDPAFKYVVTAMVITQVLACYLLKDSDWLLILIQAYCSGGLFNHALELAVHEVSHNAAFGNGHPIKNRFFGIFANLPIGIPFSVSFKKYHLEHHSYLGEDGLDTDVPTELEARLFNTTLKKLVWLAFQAFFYAFRPIIIYRKTVSDFEIVNFFVQLVFDYCIIHFCSWKAMAYLLLSSFLAMGLHPTAGHFVAEHYIFKPWQDTYSYYGPLNMVTFNVGYHVEHHDFPYISGLRLPEVRKIAPEYYSDLMHHTSWVWVLYQYVVNPNLGPYARIKRKARKEPDPSTANLLLIYVDSFLHYIGYFQARNYLKHMFLPMSIGSKSE